MQEKLKTDENYKGIYPYLILSYPHPALALKLILRLKEMSFKPTHLKKKNVLKFENFWALYRMFLIVKEYNIKVRFDATGKLQFFTLHFFLNF